MKNKGQTFMPDYVASLLVFAILLGMFLSAWNSVLSDQVSFTEEERMRVQAVHTSTFLVATPGHPENWEDTGVDPEIPGFASPDHVLQEEKLEAFRSLPYEEQRTLLQARDFYLSIENSTSIIKMSGSDLEFGKNYSGAETVVPVTRNVQVNISGDMKTAKMNYVVWR